MNKKFLKYTFSVVLLMLTCCQEKKEVKVPAPLVRVARAIKEDVPLTLEVPAKITGSLEIQIRAQVRGILKSRVFQEGQYVFEGEKLFLIDPAPFEAALAQAKGNLAQAESELRRTQRDNDRMRRLFKDGAVSKKEHDDALSAFERASANVEVAKGALHNAEINLGYTEVKAPISGIVRKEVQSIGNLVESGGLLTSMVKVCPLHANFSVSSSIWSKVVRGSHEGEIALCDPKDFEVEVLLADGTKYPRTGKIIFIDSSEDNLTSSVSIKAEIPADKDQKILIPGQFVRAKVLGAKYKNVVVIPASALISSPTGYVVYCVDQGTKIVSICPVKAEIVGNDAIIRGGLAEGEYVISEGVIKARPGMPVNVADSETTTEVAGGAKSQTTLGAKANEPSQHDVNARVKDKADTESDATVAK